MDKITLIQITNEHNAWLDILQDKRQEIETSSATLFSSPEKIQSSNLDVSELQSRVSSALLRVDALKLEINENLLEIARQAEEQAGLIDDNMMARHAKMKQEYYASAEVILELAKELGDLSGSLEHGTGLQF